MGKTNFGSIQLSEDAVYDSNGNQILADQQPTISSASTAHALSATFTDTEVEAALDALGSKVNEIITVLKAHGLIA